MAAAVRRALILLAVVSGCAATLRSVGPSLPGAHGLLLLPDGGAWLADSFGRLSPERAVWTWVVDRWVPAPLPKLPPLAGLAAGPRGSLLACAFEDDRVLWLDADGGTLATWPLAQPWNAQWVDDRPWALSGAGALVTLEPDGGVTPRLTGLDAPFDFAPASGGVWISEQVADPQRPGRVTWFSDDRRSRAARYPFQNPEGVALTTDGALLVADTERRELVLVRGDGSAVRVAIVDGLPVLIRRSGNTLRVSVTGKASRLLDVTLH